MFKKFFIVPLLILIIASPLEVLASHTSDGRGTSSSLRRKINRLDDDRVDNIPMPILFGLTPDNIRSDFGDPRSGGRKHEGLDIMAPKGAPIVSPTEAVVVRMGTGDSAGKYVYTANPGDETFAYLHLDEFADIDEGDVLAKGDLIGYVGNTGNASTTAPHLHFEIGEDGDPTDPFPRIKSIFPMKDKIEYLEEILDNADDEEELAEFIVKMYRNDLAVAKSLAIVLPEEIEQALLTAPAYIPPTATTTNTNGDLKLGSRGNQVVALQNFLISKNIGSASTIVADGNFGPMTQRALIEYQASAGITPASGYYGPITRAYILSHP